jgi:hypothetical protein
MPDRSHSTFREGVIVGLIGAAVVALWYFIIDLAGGRGFYTPGLIARVLFGLPEAQAESFGMIALVTVIHLTVFALIGIALTAMLHLGLRHPAWRMGVVIGFVVATGFISGMMYALGPASGDRIPVWEVIGGSLLGVAAMIVALRRHHAALLDGLRGVALGDETESPPHAPGASHGDLRR